MNRLVIQQTLQEANKTFFLPHSIQLDLLKNCSQVIPTLVQWMYDEWHVYDSSLTKEKLFSSFNKRLNNDRIPLTFVALKEMTPIGMIALKQESDPAFSDFPVDSLWMGSLHVIPLERRQKLGEHLLNFAAKMARQLGYAEMHFYTSNPNNVAWYLKRGAHIIDKRLLHNHTVTVMRMPTDP